MPSHYPVGLPGLAAFAIGMLAFVTTLLMARSRGTRAPASPDALRNNGSVAGIVVQGMGIACPGFGPLAIVRDPLAPTVLLEGAVVLVLVLGAVWLFDASSRAMGRNWALVARTRGDGTLVETGPFAVVRNPIYVALFCFMIAMAIAYGHFAQLLIGIPLFALGTRMRVAHEERVLRGTFGGAFDAYARRVKRFVPGVF